MFGIGIFEVVFLGLIVTVPLVLLFLVIFVGRKAGGGSSTDETRLVQELMQGLKGLEERIESLETLLIERGNRP